MTDIRILKAEPKSITGAEKMPLITDENGELARRLKVDLSTFPEGSDRDDALACEWLDISPYWKESYKLVCGSDGIVRYEPTT